MLLGGVGLLGYTFTRSRPAIACPPSPEAGSLCAKIAADEKRDKVLSLVGGGLILGALVL
jgi:hypothetical protein